LYCTVLAEILQEAGEFEVVGLARGLRHAMFRGFHHDL
jgi:hypothetical protein